MTIAGAVAVAAALALGGCHWSVSSGGRTIASSNQEEVNGNRESDDYGAKADFPADPERSEGTIPVSYSVRYQGGMAAYTNAGVPTTSMSAETDDGKYTEYIVRLSEVDGGKMAGLPDEARQAVLKKIVESMAGDEKSGGVDLSDASVNGTPCVRGMWTADKDGETVDVSAVAAVTGRGDMVILTYAGSDASGEAVTAFLDSLTVS